MPNKARKSFWTHLTELLGDEAQVESCYGPYGDSVSIMEDRCTVYAKRTIGTEIILDAPDSTPR